MAAPLPNLSLSDGVTPDKIDAPKIAKDWLARLEEHLSNKSVANASDLFLDDCWWRDILALSWDWTTKHGQEAIFKYINDSKIRLGKLQAIESGALQPMFVDMGGLQWVQSGFTFETSVGTGRGLVRFVNVSPEDWRAWTVYTGLDELKGLSSQTNGVNSHANSSGEDLPVVIIGGGQSGLILGVWLKKLGLRHVILEQNARVGDSWRRRYKSLTLHTPVYTDHYPFKKFPAGMPTWLERDDVADWMEQYAQDMGLDVMLESYVSKVDYDDSAKRYTVEAQTPTGKQIFRTRHVVCATGVLSTVPIRPEFDNEKAFKGRVYHSVQHESAAKIPDVQNKKIVVVGSGTSGHDIAEDFVKANAASVSLVQRHPIFFFSRTSMEKMITTLWNTPGISTEEADLMSVAFPFPILRTMSVGQTQMMAQMDKETIDGMEKAGMKFKKGEDGVGFFDYQMFKLGHFYIDQGAAHMICDGKIKILNDEGGVKGFYEGGVVMADGRQTEADVVVLATGFKQSGLTVEQIMGKDVKEKVGDIGHLDEEYERIGWSRPTGQQGFWYFTGPFLTNRQLAPVLSMQIAAVEYGINPDYYETQGDKSRKTVI